MRSAELAGAARGLPLVEMMERAGVACAAAMQARFPEGPVVVLCGPGANGGDGLVAARHLAAMGREVTVVDVLDGGGARQGDAALQERAWTAPRRPSQTLLELVPGAVVLDAIFGSGLNRPLGGEAARIAGLTKASRARLVAVDVPSGVSGDLGRIIGSTFRADLTVTFQALKPAHVLQPSASACGAVEVADIGIADEVESRALARLNAPELWLHEWPWPDALAYKHKRGSLVVVTGGAARTGAARLASRAGLRIGAGLVTLACPPSALAIAAAASLAVMTAAFRSPADLVGLAERSVVVIGPAAGADARTADNVLALRAAGRPLVLDADALTAFASSRRELFDVLDPDCAMTPHAGEFERLFPGQLNASTNKIEAVRRAAREAGCVVLLKGADTVIAHPDGRAVVNLHASPFLATAGSGDVLAGCIGGLMAQGMEAFAASCAGAWAHGDAGLRAGPGLTAEDLDASMRMTIAALHSRATRE